MKSKSKHSKQKRIANSLIMDKTALGFSKEQAKDKHLDVIRSLNTANKYKAHVLRFLEFLSGNRLPASGPFHVEHMQEFLFELAEEERDQRYIDSSKRALDVTFSVKLSRVESEVPIILESRSYSFSEVEQVLNFQTPRNRFATELCFAAGLRAHEALTLRRGEELAPSPHRTWDMGRFTALSNYKIYTVEGKGGLCRNVAIPLALAERLERRRLAAPVKCEDRGIFYESVYDIGGGQALSQSFTTASKRALGFSNGFHGLRHAYAKKRLADLIGSGLDTEYAMKILSEELGHFRVEIVLAYLR